MLTEIKRNVFDYADMGIVLAHCIAADLRMGAGIAVPMQKRFGIRGKILAEVSSPKHPMCVYTKGVFNLITKAKSSGKPTYASLEACIRFMRSQAIVEEITHIAMPRIGCGLDRLSWPKVREVIEATFDDTGIDITVCRL